MFLRIKIALLFVIFFISVLPGIATTLDTLIICNGQSINIAGTIINSAGQYSITFQPGDSVVIYTVYVSQPYVSLGDDITICERTVGLLTPQGSGGYYTWNNGAVADSIFIGVSGTYSVTLTDAYGCTAADAIQVTIHPKPDPSIQSIPDPVCFGSSDFALIGLPAGGTFSGDLLAGNIFLASQAAPGFYNVYYTYTDSVGCSATVNSYIHVALCNGIDLPSESENKVQILNRMIYAATPTYCRIFDVQGSMLHALMVDGKSDILFQLNNGLYLIETITNEERQTLKILLP
jgi:hypothetical protein